MSCAGGTLIGRARRRANGDDDDDDECERERRRALARFERGAETATRGARGEGGRAVGVRPARRDVVTRPRRSSPPVRAGQDDDDQRDV